MDTIKFRRFSPASLLALAISISTGFTIIFGVSSFTAAVLQTDHIAAQKQRDTIERSLRQIGSSSARELKVQTVWTEGYTNSTARNIEWMNTYYGPYLHRLLNYEQIMILSDTNELIYAYGASPGDNPKALTSSLFAIDDLIDAVRVPGAPTAVPVSDASFELGKGQTVSHRSASDMRLIGDTPMIVVVATIIPDTPLTEPLTKPPFLMVAMLPMDESLLARVASDFGFTGLNWGDRPDETEVSAQLTAYDGSNVGSIKWKAERPAYDLITRMSVPLLSAFTLFVSLGIYLSVQATRQARSIDKNSLALARANRSLQRRAEDRTMELEATLDCMAQGLILLRGDGTIAVSNSQVMSLLGVPKSNELDERVKALLEEFKEPRNTHEQRADGNKVMRRDITLPDGRVVEVRSVALSEDRRVLTITDITLSKKRQSDLEKAIVQANAANEAKTRFLSTMSHEMRTPLNGVIGALELIGGTTLTKEQTELVDVAIEASEALLAHINDVLDFSKMEAGKLELVPKPFVLMHMVQSVRDIIATQAEAAGNRLIMQEIGTLPTVVVGDRMRLRQVLLNLVSNANKFTRQGSITIDVAHCGGTPERPQLEISVTDTGIGIPKDRVHDLFQEFSMLDSSLTRRSSGTGLGLAISKRLIESMGGEIGVTSEEGRGSRFWFKVELPASDHDASLLTPLATKSNGLARRLNILLVDDNATNRLVGTRLLQAAGHNVSTATNGREAVQQASNYPPFDMIFMDISMPELDGVQATQLIRQMPEPQRAVKIVALTANAIAGDRERFLAAGMDGYLTKPLKKASIQELLNRQFSAEATPEAGQTEPATDYESDAIVDLDHLALLSSETSPETVQAIVESFIAEMKERMGDLALARDSQALDNLKRCAHAIAGASASVGALRARHIAADIESACIKEAALEAQALVDVLIAALSDAYTALADATSSHTMLSQQPDQQTPAISL